MKIKIKCPVCDLEIIKEKNYYKCNNNHIYDIAKSNYINLHLSQYKKSSNPGDSKEMMRSRKYFLDNGYYKMLSRYLIKYIESISVESNAKVLDLGCGEGYYLNELEKYFINNRIEKFIFTGIDISKEAILLASKRKLKSNLVVASANQLPFFDKTLDIVYSIFSPVFEQEILRVMKKDGICIVVGPGEDHLLELATYVYDKVLPHKGNHQILDNSNYFKLKEEVEIKEYINVIGSDILNLLKMTPYYWQINESKKSKLLTLDNLKVKIHFSVKIYKILNCKGN